MPIKTLLIKPPKYAGDYDNVLFNFEPLGLLCIASFVKKFSSHQVSLLDMQSEAEGVAELADGRFRMEMSDEAFKKRLKEEAPEVVGITALFWVQDDIVIALAKKIKELSPKTVIVIGGLNSSISYKKFLEIGCIDLVVWGEGEESFLDILNRKEQNKPLSGIAGTCDKIDENGKLTYRLNPPRTPQVPFDDYPFPDRELVDRSAYDNPENQSRSFPYSKRSPVVLMQTSRGCTLKCTFCSIIAVSNKWRAHSAEYVVDEIEECMKSFGSREFAFLDDNFMLDTDRVMKICSLIIERKLDITFDVMSGISVWKFNEKMIDLMVEAGLYRACLPIETGNPQTIKFIRKPINLKRMKQVIEHCLQKGVYTFANIIIGFPYETKEDIQRSIEWSNNSKLDAVNYHVAHPVEGAQMYEIYINNGWMIDNAHWKTEHFSSVELARWSAEEFEKYNANRLKFYLNPLNVWRYLIPKLNSWENICYLWKLVQHQRRTGGARQTTDKKLYTKEKE